MSLPQNVRPARHTAVLPSHLNPLILLLLTSTLSVVETSISRLTLPPAFSTCVCSSTKKTLLVASLFVFNDTATTEIYTLALHDALPISFAVAVTASVATG